MVNPAPHPPAPRDLRLRPVLRADLDTFFTHQLDPEAIFMAAFTASDPSDRHAFDAHWERLLHDNRIVARTVLVGERVAGYVLRYEHEGRGEVTYWFGREFWGQGVATAALAAFLAEWRERPLYARVAADNRASLRVLQKCGFANQGKERGFANARGAEIDEFVLMLS